MFEAIVSEIHKGWTLNYSDCKTVYDYLKGRLSRDEILTYLHPTDFNFYHIFMNQKHLKPLLETVMRKEIKY